jgi:hypothetical protein
MKIIDQPKLLELTTKTIIVHTTTYFLMGIIASSLFNYAARFAQPDMASWLRPLSDPIVMAGPLFQPLRGIIFALVFYPLRTLFFHKKYGWLLMWWILVALGVVATFGSSLGSLEGLIYSSIPIPEQLVGLLEVVPQTLFLSVILCFWINHPEKKWINWIMGSVFFLVILLPIIGLLMK